MKIATIDRDFILSNRITSRIATTKHEIIPTAAKKAETLPSKNTASVAGGTLFGGIGLIASLFCRKKIPSKNLQKTFEQYFGREVSLGEAKIITERYKSIQKITNPEEYARAIFQEAKSNFGFANSKIELATMPEILVKTGAIGSSVDAFTRLCLKKGHTRDKIFEVIHHEFRHFRQQYIMFNYSPQIYMQALNNRIEVMSGGKVKNCWKDVEKFKEFISGNIGEPCSIENIRQADIPFARECIAAKTNYLDNTENFEKYYKNFLESDARRTGDGMLTLLKAIMKNEIEQ